MGKRTCLHPFDSRVQGPAIKLTRTNGKQVRIALSEIVSFKQILWGIGEKHRATMVKLEHGFYLVTQSPSTIKKLIEQGGEA